MKFSDFSNDYLESFNNYMHQILSKERDEVEDAMNYSLQAGGKRIRPLMLLATLKALRQPVRQGYDVAVALEWIHTYSLIHDDLPAIDNDDLRRGKPTNHKVYGEATAILAGDGLLTQAFYILAASPDFGSDVKVDLIRELAHAAGTSGMIAGQNEDIQAENQSVSLEALEAIHHKKTGALIRYALYAGGRLAEQEDEVLDLLDQLAQHVGLAFQIRDDILDVVADSKALGKQVGQDEKLGKSTYPSLLGLDQSFSKLDKELDAALEHNQALVDQVEDFDGELFASMVQSLRLDRDEWQ